MAQRRFLNRVLRRGMKRKPGRVALDVAPGLPERDVARVRSVVADLLCLHDTMTQRAEAAVVADAYLTLSDDGRRHFLELLAREFWTDPEEIDTAMRALRIADDRRSGERALRDALTPRAHALLQLFTGLPGSTAA
jgi:malonyl-CoA decarboxylase